MRDFMQKLNNKYFDMFRELAGMGEQIPTKQYGIMSDVLFKQYLDELDVLEKKYEVANSQAIFELNYKHAMYVPRRRGLFRKWNRIARLLLKKYDGAYDKMLIGMEKVVTASQTATIKAMQELLANKTKLKQDREKLAKDKEKIKKKKATKPKKQQRKKVQSLQTTALIAKPPTEPATTENNITE